MVRSISRLRIVLPAQRPGDPRAPATVEALAQRMADALAVQGIQVRQHVAGASADGAPRADAALWLPDVDGTVMVPDARTAAARVQVALVIDENARPAALQRYDAVVVPHAALAGAIQHALKRAGGREPAVHVARVPCGGVPPRDAEKALRGVTGWRVALVDVRSSFEAEIERVVVQLGLRAQGGAAVLLVPHDDRARARTRAVCERHAVDAWIASGPEAVASSAPAVDLFVGRPSWDELVLLSLLAVDVVVPPDDVPALARVLTERRVVDDRHSVLQLAATLDRKLADPGALDARGIALREALCGPERELLDALTHVDPMPDGARASQWEAVGPHAQQMPSGTPFVDARDPLAPPEPSRAQRIEDQLQALKERLAKDRAT